MTAPVLHHHPGLLHRERLQVRHKLGFMRSEPLKVPLGDVGQDDVELPTRQPALDHGVLQHRQLGQLATRRGHLGGRGGVTAGVLPQPRTHRHAAIGLVQTLGLKLRHRHRDTSVEPVTHLEGGLQRTAVQRDLQLFDQCSDGPQRHAGSLANTSSISNTRHKKLQEDCDRLPRVRAGEKMRAMSDTMTKTEIDVVREFLGALERLDIDAATKLLAPDVEYRNVPLPSARGLREVEKQLRFLERFCTGFEVDYDNIAAEGPIVLTERTDVLVRGRFRAAFWVCGTFEVHDGRIQMWRDRFDFVDFTLAFVRGGPEGSPRSLLTPEWRDRLLLGSSDQVCTRRRRPRSTNAAPAPMASRPISSMVTSCAPVTARPDDPVEVD